MPDDGSSKVAGLTINDAQLARGNSRLAADKSTRSAVLSPGRPTWRRRTANSWRSTTISNSLNSCERKARATNCSTLKCDVTDGEDHDASGNVRKAPLFYTGRINAPHR